MELKLNELEVQKLNLQPGEVLVVKIKSDDLTQDAMYQLRTGLSQYFPNNKILVLGVGESGDIDLTVARMASYDEPKPQVGCGPTPADYCSNCSCGKKEAYEGKDDETT